MQVERHRVRKYSTKYRFYARIETEEVADLRERHHQTQLQKERHPATAVTPGVIVKLENIHTAEDEVIVLDWIRQMGLKLKRSLQPSLRQWSMNCNKAYSAVLRMQRLWITDDDICVLLCDTTCFNSDFDRVLIVLYNSKALTAELIDVLLRYLQILQTNIPRRNHEHVAHVKLLCRCKLVIFKANSSGSFEYVHAS